MELPKITLVYPYYDNPKMFIHQQHEWNEWPDHLFQFFEVIVTDDCSPRWPAVGHVLAAQDRKFNFSLYRIKKNVRWNWIAAKNLGAHHAKGKWLFLTDMDHRLSHESFSFLLRMALTNCFVLPTDEYDEPINFCVDKEKYYTFDRVDAPDMTPYKNHPNTYFMTKKLFWKLGGYDEEFSGYYGTDGYYRKRLNQVCRGELHLDGVPVIRYSREIIADASTTEFRRKTEHDRSKKDWLKAKFEESRPMEALTFPWEQLI